MTFPNKLELPSDVILTLELVNSKVYHLEEKLSNAKIILEKIRELENSPKFLSLQDMETFKETSAEKVEDAIALQATIKALRNEKDFLSVEEIKKMTSIFEAAKSKLFLKEIPFS